MEEKKLSIPCLASDYVEKSKLFLCVQHLLKKMFIKLKYMKKNVKQKTGFRWKRVLKSMFFVLFTRKNYEQSSIIYRQQNINLLGDNLLH